MKKLLVLLMVLGIAAPSMAALTLTGSASGTTVTIGYSYTPGGSGFPRAFALKLDTQDTAIHIDSVTPAKTGMSTSAAKGFGVFPGTIAIDGSGNVTAWGTPVEPDNLHGTGQSATGTSKVIVALGSLYGKKTGDGDANRPAASGTLFTAVVTGSCILRITPEDTYRGGVVDENALAIIPTVGSTTNPLLVTVTADCVKATAPFYADWVTFGKPACWCYARNCKGDADGLKQGSVLNGYSYVYTNDLNVLGSAWNIKEPPKGAGIATVTHGICADFARDKQGSVLNGYARVYTNDLNILGANWNVKEPPKGAGIANCGTTNYEFFTTP